jgi:DNA (cytosine-5)-methyltransferase 1
VALSVIDFFSGCGGTSLGLKQAGMQIIAGIDHDPDAAATYRQNFPEAQFIERDIRQVDASEVGELLPSGDEVVFAGCAPCQPFSKQNKAKNDADPRRLLLGEFQRFVSALKPHHVIVENVPGLQRVGRDGPLADFIDELERLRYTVTWRILHASHYGVPQRRTRFVLLASMDPARARLPTPTHGPKRLPVTTVRDWMAGLPPLAAGQVDASDPDHAAMALSDQNLRRIAVTPEGGGRESWPHEMRLECHVAHEGHSDVYGRLAWDRPASAMTTRCLSYSNGRFGHPNENRAISVREAACLQTFPRSFRFSGSITSRGRQIGNAVPPVLAEAVGRVLTGMDAPEPTAAPTLF